MFKESALNIKKRVVRLYDPDAPHGLLVAAPQQLVMQGQRYFVVVNLVCYDNDTPWGRFLARRERLEIVPEPECELSDAIHWTLHAFLVSRAAAVL